jgi:hypothetical protein
MMLTLMTFNVGILGTAIGGIVVGEVLWGRAGHHRVTCSTTYAMVLSFYRAHFLNLTNVLFDWETTQSSLPYNGNPYAPYLEKGPPG